MVISARSSHCRSIGEKANGCAEKAADGETSLEEIDRDVAILASLCANSDPADEERLDRVLEEARRQAKEQVRRQMRLR